MLPLQLRLQPAHCDRVRAGYRANRRLDGRKAAIFNGDDRMDEVRWNIADLDELSFFALRRKNSLTSCGFQVDDANLLHASQITDLSHVVAER